MQSSLLIEDKYLQDYSRGDDCIDGRRNGMCGRPEGEQGPNVVLFVGRWFWQRKPGSRFNR